MKKEIKTSNAPKAIGPYSQAVLAGQFLFASGQIPIDPATGELVSGGIEEQAHCVFLNIKAILDEAGLGFTDVVSATVYLSDINDFSTVNHIYSQYFAEGVLPSRCAFGVAALPKNARLEIACIAYKV